MTSDDLPPLPDLMPLFGFHGWGADTTCDRLHRGPMPEYTRYCCMVCHKTGAKNEARIRAHALADAERERRERLIRAADFRARVAAQRHAKRQRKHQRRKSA